MRDKIESYRTKPFKRVRRWVIQFLYCSRILVVVITVTAFLAGCGEVIVTSKPMLADSNPTPQVMGTITDNRSNIGSLDTDTLRTLRAVQSDDIIRPGDQVQVTVWGYPEFNTTTTVKDYGTITIPLIGDVIAAGLTETQLEAQLKERLAEYVKGDARVTISHVGMDKRVSIMGAVVRQGNYPVLNSVSLVEILASAGGASDNADLRHVKIFRSGSPNDIVEVDLSNYLQSGRFQKIPKVGPGDVVFIPQKENIVREIGGFGQDILVLFGFFTILR
jgi:polysaccharide export outer membrane protein